jgi:acetylornithine deacetylase/succinyl-diaminopimelate desuccinylase family protein
MSVQSHICEFIDGRRIHAVELLAELISFQTGHDTDVFESEVQRCQFFLAERLRRLEMRVETSDSEGRYPVTVGCLRGMGTQSIALNGHIDVKPPGDVDAWDSDPWSATEKDGRLYGRGAADMKGGVAAALLAIEALRDSGFDRFGEVWLHLVSDEEIGGPSTKRLLERGPVPDAVIVPEPTGLAVTPTEAGMIFLRLEVEGVETHAGNRYALLYPGHAIAGVSAIEKALTIVAALQELEKAWASKKPHPRLPAGFTTIGPGIIEGGPGGGAGGRLKIPRQPPATISDYCSVEYCIWYAPNETYEEIVTQVERHIHHTSELDPWLTEHPPKLTWKVRDGFVPPVDTPLDDSVVAAVAAAVDFLGREVRYGGFTATADLAWYVERGVPGVLFGPGDIAQAHSPNEFVVTDDVLTAAKVLALAVCHSVPAAS